MTKSRFILISFFSAALLAPLDQAQAKPNFSITFDGQYSRVITHAVDLGHSNGLGGTLFLEFQPVDFFSLGIAGNFTTYFGISDTAPPVSFSAFADGILRVMPLGQSGRWAPYLISGFGWNPVSAINIPGWKGEFHALAGLGTRYFVDSHGAMDIGLDYQLFSPGSDPLQTANFHVGLSYFFDPIPALTKPLNIPLKAQLRYDSLQAIAGREYGDPNLYPILLDANPRLLTGGMASKGSPLAIPRNITPETIRLARIKALEPKYMAAAESYHDPYLSDDFHKTNQATGSSLVPLSKKKRSFIPFHAESLWEIASRPDVYGDPELYPLLVDANRKRLQAHYPAKAFNLIIPSANAELIRRTRLKAWAVEYILWRGRDITEKEYKTQKNN